MIIKLSEFCIYNFLYNNFSQMVYFIDVHIFVPPDCSANNEVIAKMNWNEIDVRIQRCFGLNITRILAECIGTSTFGRFVLVSRIENVRGQGFKNEQTYTARNLHKTFIFILFYSYGRTWLHSPLFKSQMLVYCEYANSRYPLQFHKCFCYQYAN